MTHTIDRVSRVVHPTSPTPKVNEGARLIGILRKNRANKGQRIAGAIAYRIFEFILSRAGDRHWIASLHSNGLSIGIRCDVYHLAAIEIGFVVGGASDVIHAAVNCG
jgi:hypothetical protein